MTDGEIARKIDELFDLRPRAIEERLKLRNPIYAETAAYGHMGRKPEVVTKSFRSRYSGDKESPPLYIATKSADPRWNRHFLYFHPSISGYQSS